MQPYSDNVILLIQDAWTKSMREDKAVMATYLEPELHARYNRSFRRKEHDFDLKKY